MIASAAITTPAEIVVVSAFVASLVPSVPAQAAPGQPLVLVADRDDDDADGTPDAEQAILPLAARTDPQEALRGGKGSVGPGRGFGRDLLVTGEVALADKNLSARN